MNNPKTGITIIDNNIDRDIVIRSRCLQIYFPNKSKKDRKIGKNGNIPEDVDILCEALRIWKSPLNKKYKVEIISIKQDGTLVEITESDHA